MCFIDGPEPASPIAAPVPSDDIAARSARLDERDRLRGRGGFNDDVIAGAGGFGEVASSNVAIKTLLG